MLCLFSIVSILFYLFFFFNDTAPTEIYTLSLHDALPISLAFRQADVVGHPPEHLLNRFRRLTVGVSTRSEEHTSELQSRLHLVCRLLLEKKKKTQTGVSARQRAAQSGCAS